MDDNQPLSLTELLAQRAEQILDRLIQELREKGGSSYQQMPLEVLEKRVQRLFDAFWQGMSQNTPKPLTDYIWMTSRKRGHEGITVAELQTVGLCLRDALLDVVDEVYAGSPDERLSHSRQIEELILSGIGAGVRGFVDGRESLIKRQYEALRRGQAKKDTDA
jgi:AcrR family transcriptional regulator